MYVNPIHKGHFRIQLLRTALRLTSDSQALCGKYDDWRAGDDSARPYSPKRPENLRQAQAYLSALRRFRVEGGMVAYISFLIVAAESITEVSCDRLSII